MWTCELIDQSEANPKAKNKGKIRQRDTEGGEKAEEALETRH